MGYAAKCLIYCNRLCIRQRDDLKIMCISTHIESCPWTQREWSSPLMKYIYVFLLDRVNVCVWLFVCVCVCVCLCVWERGYVWVCACARVCVWVMRTTLWFLCVCVCSLFLSLAIHFFPQWLHVLRKVCIISYSLCENTKNPTSFPPSHLKWQIKHGVFIMDFFFLYLKDELCLIWDKHTHTHTHTHTHIHT